ncbi:MAG: hypothetical protein K6E99_04410 [Bacilli bacterium]|nr:hypothetical protein [Bacilli bacterium]
MTETNNEKPVLTDAELGLEEMKDNKQNETNGEVKNKKQTISKQTSKGVKKADDALKNAAATAALKAAIDANTELSVKEAEKTYIKEKMKFMLDKCKSDEVVEFRGDKIYAPYFGKVYTFLYNAIPVTVRFDGSVQKFPKFICEKIKEKVHEVSESNTPKVIIEDRTGQ